MMKLKELKEMNISQLASLAEKSRLQLIEYRFNQVTGELKDTSVVRKTKRLIARCMTLINEKKSTEVSS
ncbi:MAG: 50S ribosomal protein L29 [Candidatus Comchoanobacterales bacterium]